MPHRHTLSSLAASFALCGALLLPAACDHNPAASPTVGIHFAPGKTSDTVGAVLDPLEVTVRGPNGSLAKNQAVQFESNRAGANNEPTVWFRTSPSQGWFEGPVSVNTDKDGQAYVQMRLGSVAGTGHVAITVPGLGMSGGLDYTIAAGAVARLVIAPADTAVYVGNGYTLRTAVTDRYGNPRPETPVLSAGTAKASLSGAHVRGETIGRGYVAAQVGPLRDTAWMSVVPPGVLVANMTSFTQARGPFVTMQTDGSAFHVLLDLDSPAANSPGAQYPRWSPAGGEAAYASASRLMAVDVAGHTRVLVPQDASVDVDYAPEYSADGQWVYYSRGSGGGVQTVWRVHPDGSGAQQVTPALDFGREVWASPEPAGPRIVYQSTRETGYLYDFTLRVLDTGTGAVTSLGVHGGAPQWSPDGAWIAYLRDGVLRRIRPDGSGDQPIGAGVRADPGFSWLPDGVWLLIGGELPAGGDTFYLGLALVNVATGEELPLPFARNMAQPSWRRQPPP